MVHSYEVQLLNVYSFAPELQIRLIRAYLRQLATLIVLGQQFFSFMDLKANLFSQTLLSNLISFISFYFYKTILKNY